MTSEAGALARAVERELDPHSVEEEPVAADPQEDGADVEEIQRRAAQGLMPTPKVRDLLALAHEPPGYVPDELVVGEALVPRAAWSARLVAVEPMLLGIEEEGIALVRREGRYQSGATTVILLGGELVVGQVHPAKGGAWKLKRGSGERMLPPGAVPIGVLAGVIRPSDLD